MKRFLLFMLLTIASAPVFAQYNGGDNDGAGSASTCVSTLDGTGGIFSIGTISGSPEFCDNGTEAFTLGLTNPPQDIDFFWTLPAGASIVNGTDSPTILVQFGSTPGVISVDVVSACGTSTLTFNVTNIACPMYNGGNNDGFVVGNACSVTLDGTPLITIAPAIAGSVNFCETSTEGYSIDVANAPANTYYNWTVPPGAVVTQGQGSNTVIITFGSTAGNVSVDIITDCVTTNRTIAVSPQNCTFYAGGDNDGFSQIPSCVTDLNGGAQFSVTGITGSTTFCEFGNESFTAVTVNPPANTYYNWTVPAGATILSGQGSPTILVNFGNTSGTVGVAVVTDCGTITPTALNVTATICSFYAGGDNDGFSNTQACATRLDGTNAFIPGPIVGSTTFCDFSTEVYTINVAGANIETTYNWSVPAGATITAGQGTNTILVTFSNNSGAVSVDVATPCQLIPVTLPVTTTNCVFYAGGNNDGFSDVQLCASNLNGGSTFIPGPVVGSTAACNFSTDSYTINVAGALANTVYVWTVPAGATITSGQGTNTILVTFGSTGGNVAVAVSNECETQNISLPVSVANCVYYAGGDNDGFSWIQQCASNLNGGSTFIPGPIVGPANSCNFSTESYSITVAGALSNAVYVWSVPAGASVTSGQGTNTIIVTFGAANGNVSVAVSNECETVNASTPVTLANCIFYAGGDNDGFSQTRLCATTLGGATALVVGPITGNPAACNFSTETYSISPAGVTSTTTLVWTVPAGSSIISGQGTNTIFVSLGNTSGNVIATLTNECGPVNTTLPITVTNCVYYAGGNGDGFSAAYIYPGPLPIQLVSFDAEVQSGVVYLKWETSTEIDNDFFVIERSRDGKTFEELVKVEGAGNSTASIRYQAQDVNPYHGTSYYRLSQTDYDGAVSYFRVLIVKILDFNEVTKLYPNPVQRDEKLNIDYFAEEDGPVNISIIDATGRIIKNGVVDAKSGVNLFQVTPLFSAAGVHFIIIRSHDKATTLRLVVL